MTFDHIREDLHCAHRCEHLCSRLHHLVVVVVIIVVRAISGIIFVRIILRLMCDHQVSSLLCSASTPMPARHEPGECTPFRCPPTLRPPLRFLPYHHPPPLEPHHRPRSRRPRTSPPLWGAAQLSCLPVGRVLRADPILGAMLATSYRLEGMRSCTSALNTMCRCPAGAVGFGGRPVAKACQ